MKGIIICLGVIKDGKYEPTLLGKKGESIFMTLYNEILEDLGLYFWLYPDGPFSSNHTQSDAEIDYFLNTLTVELDDVAEPRSLFPKLARWIKDDNNRLFGFTEKPSSQAVKWLDEGRYSEEEEDKFIRENVEVFLCNVDGAYWEFYSKNEALYEKCLTALKNHVEEKCITLLNYSEREDFYRMRNGAE